MISAPSVAHLAGHVAAGDLRAEAAELLVAAGVIRIADVVLMM